MTVKTIHPGQAVTLDCPDNPRLHGAEARVAAVESWGAHVETRAAATGRYRAGWDELRPLGVNGAAVGRRAGYEGDPCPTCGALRLRRNGACLVCDECGSTTGCS